MNWNAFLSERPVHTCVAPSRVRELKPICQLLSSERRSRTLTGAWIETRLRLILKHLRLCRTLTGAWIETSIDAVEVFNGNVAPSRVRELKLTSLKQLDLSMLSHPHGCVNWNRQIRKLSWIKIVAPSRVRELKRIVQILYLWHKVSHPHGCVNWNLLTHLILIRTLSHPHGCVNWNSILSDLMKRILSRTLTGAWIETLDADVASMLTKSHPHGCVNWNCLF